MNDIIIIIADENSTYANNFNAFFKQFCTVNGQDTTTLLIFKSGDRYKKFSAGKFSYVEDFPAYCSFTGGYNWSKIQEWIDETKEFRELNNLRTEKLLYNDLAAQKLILNNNKRPNIIKQRAYDRIIQINNNPEVEILWNRTAFSMTPVEFITNYSNNYWM